MLPAVCFEMSTSSLFINIVYFICILFVVYETWYCIICAVRYNRKSYIVTAYYSLFF